MDSAARSRARAPHPFDDLLALEAGDLRLALAPAVGGSIASLRSRVPGAARDVDWLRPASAEGLAAGQPLAMASFPLVPFCNRIRDGRAEFEGRPIRFPPNHPAEDSPHPLHGIGWLRPWAVESARRDRAVLSLHVEAGPAWPWAFSARQVFELSPTALAVSISVTNEDGAAMPAGIGHHPYFPKVAGVRLEAPAQAMWEADDEVLPTGLADTALSRALREGLALADVRADNNFAGWERHARIDWPAAGGVPARSLLLQAQAPLDHFVLYCQPQYDFFCAEPVSQCTDWLNLAHRYPAAVLGGARLEPGQTLEAAFTMAPRWEPPGP